MTLIYLRRRCAPIFHPCKTCLTILILLLLASPTLALEPMLAERYSEQVDVRGWLMSEKLDGVRGYWDGKQMFSKNGNRLHPPRQFTRGLPPFPLEGELWAGRQRFEQTVSAVRKQNPHAGWLQLRFAIFDVPEAPGGFSERIARARAWFARHPSSYAFVIPQINIDSQEQVLEELERIEELGGEGLIVRQPEALYVAGRRTTILKVKSHQDAEATVLAHLPGKGRNAGRLGSLLVALPDGTRFKIGTGFSDLDRDEPPAIGSVVTFRYFGTYQSGIPKFPSFMRARGDLDL